MIRRIELNNFKSHKHTALDFSNLTVLCGANGSGKSSVIQSLLLIRESNMTNSQELFEYLNLNTDSIKIGTAKDALYYFSEKDEISFGILSDCENITLNFHIKDLTKGSIKKSTHCISSHCILKEALFQKEKCQFISAARLGPQLSYPKNDLLVDAFEQISEIEGKAEYVVHFLEKKRNQEVIPEICKTGFATDLFTQVTAWEREICYGVNLFIEDKGLLGYELKYQLNSSEGKTDKFNAINIGFGLTYALPIIVAILAAQKGDILFIENPEAHLHPKGQAQLAELIALAAQVGIQIVIETHSDHIINGILIQCKKYEIENKGIDKNNVNLYSFNIQEGNVYSSVEDIKILEGGKIDKQPEGFFDQIQNDLKIIMGF
jgi:predicted ATPase